MKKYIIVSIIVATLFVGGSIMAVKAATTAPAVAKTPTTLSISQFSSLLARSLASDLKVDSGVLSSSIKGIIDTLSMSGNITPINIYPCNNNPGFWCVGCSNGVGYNLGTEQSLAEDGAKAKCASHDATVVK